MNQYSQILVQLRNGLTHEELTQKLDEVVAAVRLTGKKGSITLTVSVEPASKGSVDTLFVEDEIKVKIPEMDRGATVFFATPENGLQRQDPRQLEFGDLRVVPEGSPSFKEVKNQS